MLPRTCPGGYCTIVWRTKAVRAGTNSVRCGPKHYVRDLFNTYPTQVYTAHYRGTYPGFVGASVKFLSGRLARDPNCCVFLGFVREYLGFPSTKMFVSEVNLQTIKTTASAII